MKTKEEIQEEIAKLQKELDALELAKAEKPIPIEVSKMIFTPLLDQVKAYVEFLWSPESNPDRDGMDESDFKTWIFEAALMMVYGQSIWEKIGSIKK